MTGEEVTKLGEYGPLLGAFTEAAWQDATVELAPGSTVVAYTDGITDAVDEERRRFGLERLQDALRDVAGRPAAEVAELLTGALTAFQTGSHADDTAAIVLHRQVHAQAPQTREQSQNHEDRLAGVRHGQTD